DAAPRREGGDPRAAHGRGRRLRAAGRARPRGRRVRPPRGLHHGRARTPPLPARAVVHGAAAAPRAPVVAAGAPAQDVALSVRDLRTCFFTKQAVVQAVRGVTFDLKRAEKLGIVGESGSGKSALALSILGLIESPGRVVGGEVWLNGRRIDTLSDRRLQRI